MIAEVCALARRAGAEFLHGGADAVARLYDHCAISGPAYECHVSAEAFQVFADLAGKSIREIVRGLPDRETRPRPTAIALVVPERRVRFEHLVGPL